MNTKIILLSKFEFSILQDLCNCIDDILIYDIFKDHSYIRIEDSTPRIVRWITLIKKPSNQMYLRSIKNDPSSIFSIKNPSKSMQKLALRCSPSLLDGLKLTDYTVIKNIIYSNAFKQNPKLVMNNVNQYCHHLYTDRLLTDMKKSSYWK